MFYAVLRANNAVHVACAAHSTDLFKLYSLTIVLQQIHKSHWARALAICSRYASSIHSEHISVCIYYIVVKICAHQLLTYGSVQPKSSLRSRQQTHGRLHRVAVAWRQLWRSREVTMCCEQALTTSLSAEYKLQCFDTDPTLHHAVRYVNIPFV